MFAQIAVIFTLPEKFLSAFDLLINKIILRTMKNTVLVKIIEHKNCCQTDYSISYATEEDVKDYREGELEYQDAKLVRMPCTQAKNLIVAYEIACKNFRDLSNAFDNASEPDKFDSLLDIK